MDKRTLINRFDHVFYEPSSLDYELGQQLHAQFAHLPWTPIENHNNIPQLRQSPNEAFPRLKRHLIVGVRKSLRYSENHKVSDYLVPYTSSGCSAMCLYCYLVCNYNKCAYLRLFVNREAMMQKLIKTADNSDHDLVFEIGSNSDLVLENIVTNNLVWTIEQFQRSKRGKLTFPTKFDMVESLLHLDHGGRIIARMSVNPQEIIDRVEFGTSGLNQRIRAVNALCDAGYPVGILIAPVVLVGNYQVPYSALITALADGLSQRAKASIRIEIIFMTYSYVHRAINRDAFPNAVPLYDKALMTGRGRGRYCYRADTKQEAEDYLRTQLAEKLPGIPILYVV